MMFRRLRLPDGDVTIHVDGRPVRAGAGDSVAAAMLAAGFTEFRTSAISAAPRAPHCMIGNCFECLVEIDGMPDRQACLITVTEGMQVRRQLGEKAA
jgi:NADH dehydrogenase/NADH:ubiquinone oxidoreductase subunit G